MIFTENYTGMRAVARYWWVYLITGIIWILFAMWLWSYRVGSLVALAVLIGITMMFNGITEIMIGARLPAWRWLVVTIGALSVVAGIVVLAWPGPTLYVIAVFLGWFLLVMGIVHIVQAFASIGVDYWWLLLILGGAELLLGAWARGDHVRSLVLFINLAALFSVFRGVNEIFAAFELRRLSQSPPSGV
jgi:uncharacterized membrane protein HdeD (DUF308 family)